MTITETGTPPDTPEAEPRRSRVAWWLSGALAIALITVAGLAVALATAKNGQSVDYQASGKALATLEGRIAAVNAGDGAAAAAFYINTAILEEIEGQPWPGGVTYTFRGRPAIAKRLQGLADSGLRMEQVGIPLQLGTLVAEPTKFTQQGGPGYGEGILLFEMDPSGKIAHQWMIGWVNSG